MIADKLRQAILQAAIQGKLTEQLKSDGNARDLLAKIQTEKAKLIKEGKIKKEKALPEITKEEEPFDIPDNWCWVRLGTVFQVNPRNVASDDTDASFMPMTLLAEGYQSRYTFEQRLWKKIKSGYTHFANNDIVFAKITPCFQNLKSAVMTGLLNQIGAGTTELHVLRGYGNLINRYYTLWFLKNPMFISDGLATVKGTAGQQRISSDYVANYLFPLPPLAEQKRIVARIEALLPELDKLSKEETQLETMQQAFPKAMKDSLLQAAIQGKLTKQLKSDGSAKDLLAKIEAEKAKLIKAGKIKKEKALPEITEDEKPFEIPSNWEWVRLGVVSSYASAKAKASPASIKPNTWVLDLEDIEKNTGVVISKKYAKDKKITGDKVCFNKGNILYSKLRPYLLKILVASEDGVGSPELVPFNMYGGINTLYTIFFLKSSYSNIVVNSATYGVKMPRVGADTMLELLMPLPPLPEQERIVKRLEQLLPLCEELH